MTCTAASHGRSSHLFMQLSHMCPCLSLSSYSTPLQYPKLCGMTGTAATEAGEFQTIYKLAVTEIPTNRSMKRKVRGAF